MIRTIRDIYENDDKENCFQASKKVKNNTETSHNNPNYKQFQVSQSQGCSAFAHLHERKLLAPLKTNLPAVVDFPCFDSKSSINIEKLDIITCYNSEAGSRSFSSTSTSQALSHQETEDDIVEFDIGKGNLKTYKKMKSFSTQQKIQIDKCWSKIDSADKFKGDHIAIYKCNIEEINCKLTAFITFSKISNQAEFYAEVGAHDHHDEIKKNLLNTKDSLQSRSTVISKCSDFTKQFEELSHIELINYCFDHYKCEEECEHHSDEGLMNTCLCGNQPNDEIHKRSFLKLLLMIDEERNKVKSFLKETKSTIIEAKMAINELNLITKFVRKISDVNNEALSQRFVDLIRDYGWDAVKEMLLSLISTNKRKFFLKVIKPFNILICQSLNFFNF